MDLPLGRIIAKAVTGSKLYGTQHLNSDTDYVQVFMNSAVRLVSLKYLSTKEQNSSTDQVKNTKDDTDSKFYDLHMFITKALSGQTFAIDMIHTPESCLISTSPIWQFVLENKAKLITNNIKPFIGYCRKQAAKYSAKSEKYLELKEVLRRIDERGFGTPIKFVRDAIDVGIFDGLTHFSYEDKMHRDGHAELYMYAPDYATPANRRFDEVVPVLRMKLGKFGERTKAAAESDGTDLKAYYHALRVVWQLEEYLNTGTITFPTPRRKELIAVRNQEFSRPFIESWIDEEIARVTEIPNELPEPDNAFWDAWLMEVYQQHAADELRHYPSPLFS